MKLREGTFKTEEDYLNSKKIIDKLIKDSTLKKTSEIDTKNPFISYGYCCLVCNRNWTLSIPDQAYRGGWFENL